MMKAHKWLLPALTATAALAIGVYLLKVSVRPAQAHTTGLASAPLHFLPNHGQAPSEVRFMTRVPGLSASFLTGEVILRVGGRTLGVTFDGASREPVIEGIGQQPGTVNFFLGSRSGAWITDVPAYSGVAYRNLYADIDLIYSESGGRLKSEFVVAPGASPSVIRLRYSGAEKLRVDDNGDLVLSTESGELREACPEIYQEADGRRSPIPGGYRLLGDGTVGFNVEEYDRTRPLVIDPILSYSTYLGGAGLDSAKAIATDAYGNAYVTGYTDSVNFPTKNAYRSSSGGGVDVFVAKLSVSGNSLVYCTYLGGGWDDRGFGIAVDAGGNASVTGWTGSPNFPTTAGARQRVLGGGRDAFVTKLNASGNALVFSTFLGGASNDSGNAIALDSAGEVYVAGDTYSSNFPVTGAFQSSSQGRQDAFAFRLRNDGSALVWSTYLGGYGDDRANAIAVDGSGYAYVAGGTDSSNFPTFAPLQGSIGGGQDAFVTKLSTDARSLIYSTYLGGSGGGVGANEIATGLQVDASGNVYVAGTTSSSNFPVVNAFQAAYKGGVVDAFVAKLNPTGSALLYSTYLGGSSVDYALGIAVDRAGVACVAGYTASTDFPILNPIQASNAGGYDVFVVKLAAQGNAMVSASYWGGSDSDVANALFMDPAGNVWIAGQTLSTNFPVKNAIQSLNTGVLTAFVAKWSEITPTAVFRATNGNTRLMSYGSTALYNAEGYITTQPGISRNSAGDTFVTGLNQTTRVYLNILKQDTQTWTGWMLVGDQKYGDPAVAAVSNGEAYIVARDSGYRYWLSRYRPNQGFDAWTSLGGTFATEPAIAAGADDSLYIAGASSSGVVSAGRYVGASGFQGWVAAGSPPLASGKPAITVGSDGAAYVAVKATTNGIWMARFQGAAWGAWYNGGGNIGKGPDLAPTDGMIYVAVTTPAGKVYVQSFAEGTANGWQGAWTFLNGYLERASIGAVRGRYYIAGRSLGAFNLWWYESGVGWTLLGYGGIAAADLAASPH